MKKKRDDILFNNLVKLWKEIISDAFDEASEKEKIKDPTMDEVIISTLARIAVTVDFFKERYKEFIEFCKTQGLDQQGADEALKLIDETIIVKHRKSNKLGYIQ